MNRSLNYILVMFVVALVSTSSTFAQIDVTATAFGRLVNEPAVSRNDNNGGGDTSTLVGFNAARSKTLRFTK